MSSDCDLSVQMQGDVQWHEESLSWTSYRVGGAWGVRWACHRSTSSRRCTEGRCKPKVNQSRKTIACQKITSIVQTSILGGDIEQDRLVVWIDPLDATQEYTEGLTQVKLFKFQVNLNLTHAPFQYVTVMVGISLDGRALGGVIYKAREFQLVNITPLNGIFSP